MQLTKNENNSDWKGWALSVTILVIAGLAGLFSGLSMTILKDFRSEVLTEFIEIRRTNHAQDLCIEKMQIHQDERLRREGKK